MFVPWSFRPQLMWDPAPDPGTPPGEKTGEDGDKEKKPVEPKVETYTKSELEGIVKRRIKGAQKAANEAAEQKRLEEEGEYKVLLEQARAENLALKEQVQTQGEYEKARLKTVQDRVVERVKALPDHLKKIVPDLAPDQLSAWLDNAAEAFETQGEQTRNVYGGGGRSRPKTFEGFAEQAQAGMRKAIFGGKD